MFNKRRKRHRVVIELADESEREMLRTEADKRGLTLANYVRVCLKLPPLGWGGARERARKSGKVAGRGSRQE